MKTILFILLLVSSLSLVLADVQKNLGIEFKNPNFNYERSCRLYTDCHNCTVSRCRWDTTNSGKCKGYTKYDEYQLHFLQIDDFFEHSAKCVDTRRLCERTDNDISRQTHLSFWDNFRYMPINYFCTFDLQKDDPKYPKDKSDFTITTGRTLYGSDKVELERVFA